MPFLSQHFRKAEMELKRKQEEEDRKKREEEEKVIQVWTTMKCDIFSLSTIMMPRTYIYNIGKEMRTSMY